MSVRKEGLYNIVIEFGITMKLIRLIKVCLNETYNKAQTGRHSLISHLIVMK
jgi:hypothetical protein